MAAARQLLTVVAALGAATTAPRQGRFGGTA